ncbi:MAG: GWxTD domain-containing protein [Proteobacteria bacterium]|nr:GWxTD domain-containing protein [Pseudomonadota bacterium]
MKKLIIIFLSLLMTSEFVYSKEKFYFDYARFYTDYNMTHVEFYYYIPLKSLKYKKAKNNTIEAHYEIYIKVTNDSTKQSYDSKWSRVSIAPLKKNTNLNRKSLVDKVDFQLLPGKYKVYTYLLDKSSKKKYEKSIDVRIKQQSQGLALSDLEMTDLIKEDTTRSLFNRNGLLILPNASRNYAKWKYILETYLEIYNVNSDSSDCTIRYYITDTNGDTVLSNNWKKVEKLGNDVVDMNIFNLLALKDGGYKLNAQCVMGKDTVGTDKEFAIKTYQEKLPQLIFKNKDEEKEYYHLEYILTGNNLIFFKKLNKEGRKNYAKYYWSRMDPNRDTPYSEALGKFINNLKFVDRMFRQGDRKGRETDRGRIYLKYGKPDQIIRKGISQQYKSAEIWKYYNKGGITFVFSDINSTGDYILIYSSIPMERTDPNWKNYIDPLWVQME